MKSEWSLRDRPGEDRSIYRSCRRPADLELRTGNWSAVRRDFYFICVNIFNSITNCIFHNVVIYYSIGSQGQFNYLLSVCFFGTIRSYLNLKSFVGCPTFYRESTKFTDNLLFTRGERKVKYSKNNINYYFGFLRPSGV